MEGRNSWLLKKTENWDWVCMWDLWTDCPCRMCTLKLSFKYFMHGYLCCVVATRVYTCFWIMWQVRYFMLWEWKLSPQVLLFIPWVGSSTSALRWISTRIFWEVKTTTFEVEYMCGYMYGWICRLDLLHIFVNGHSNELGLSELSKWSKWMPSSSNYHLGISTYYSQIIASIMTQTFLRFLLWGVLGSQGYNGDQPLCSLPPSSFIWLPWLNHLACQYQHDSVWDTVWVCASGPTAPDQKLI